MYNFHNNSVSSRLPRVARMRAVAWMMFLLTIWIGPALGQDQTQTQVPSVTNKPTVARLTCDQQVKYKLSVGKWVIQRPGASDLVMPFQLNTGHARCRVEMPSGAVLQVDEGSLLKLSSVNPSGLDLELKQGAFFYYMPDGYRVRVTARDITAVSRPAAKAVEPGPDEKPWDGYASMGFVRMPVDQDLCLYNFSGQIQASNRSGRQWEIGQGYRLQVPRSIAMGNSALEADTQQDVEGASGAAGVLAQIPAVAAPGRNAIVRLEEIEDPLAVVMDEAPTLRYSVDDLPEVGQRLSPWTPPPRVRNLPAPVGDTSGSSSSSDSSASTNARLR